MFDGLINAAEHHIQNNPWFAIIAVFVGGVLTASNPCVLTMIPLMMSFVASRHEEKPSVARAFFFSMLFVLGLSITFTALGIAAALAGEIYGDVSGIWNFVVAAVCVVMGLHLADVITVPIPSIGERLQPRMRGVLGALILGLLFGVVSAPCAAPILVVLLTYLAGSRASVPYGGFLLFTYALGHSVLVLLAGTSMGIARQLIENRKATRILELLRRAAGATIVLVGIYFAYRGLRT